ncbi:type IV toxin-antitoxin system AbiEi family antitoxin domain-containing protein [Nocardioides humilatus]|uniref:type IV toxin-antitoxin system AbiEi family antitoxin domain-containing protein n=1 Tax=Nocardioides humilatus TaxID=2607660 RepID=UPI001CB7251E|nr:type IV toxin-antitoxin system AbiEi family antitoxin domain-containing protein [Nocardioides humilatus]
MDAISDLLALQDGVISRRQALEAGLRPHSIERLLRRRVWVAVHPGVYVDHTGRLSWRQRAWAAVLACWPAALDGRSSLRAHEGPGRRSSDGHPIEVMVAHSRRVDPPAGVQVRRSRRFDEQVHWNLNPPRMHYDATIIEIADTAARELDVIAVLADACGARRTTAARLRDRIDDLPRLHQRDLLLGILDDVAEGTCSVLEHRYLTHVERPHGLPRGLRQDAVIRSDRPMLRDVVYRGLRGAWTQVVELDGRLHHDSATARDRDMERDLDAALEREHSVRIGYGQTFERACVTAAKLDRLLVTRGWAGRAKRCPKCPG